LLEHFGRWYEPVRAVLDAADSARIVRQEVHDLDGIDTWSAGRVTLLGDAAHAMLPALGQGGCMAIEDAWELGRELGSGGDVPEALRRYQGARRDRVNATAREARRLSALHHSPSPLLRLIRLPFLRFAPARVVMRNLETLLDWERP
jgi:2-polyprenyl-6-methoxyphenol hydroxylase-like FAD-dependent oxidoreductase